MTIDRSIGKLTLILTVVSLTFASDLWPSCTGKTMIILKADRKRENRNIISMYVSARQKPVNELLLLYMISDAAIWRNRVIDVELFFGPL
ncbi:hypothetical protein WN51_09461 [Melipona quadrifasciata]|uniref:Uncharacterized protein n=1 Tax=Melipona quadrifasciata TaxID=166423 RepID=A0A0N0BBK5_9HYME|nr:hypothetical protein WN51_09461 [Melipona quadrifasciata]